MTDHLPECSAHYEFGTILNDCICDMLRACEQRVMEDVDIILPKCTAKSYREGYAAALDAAEAAVAGVKKFVEFPGQPVNYIHPDFFLAAIRALKEKP